MATQGAPSEPPWYSFFPEPKSKAATISAPEVLGMLSRGDTSFLLVDVRRNDFEYPMKAIAQYRSLSHEGQSPRFHTDPTSQGGTIHSSLNLPAQSFWHCKASLHDLCKRAGKQNVIFYCGSSTGRGTRCAGWFQDECNAQKDSSVVAVVLKGGIKGWVASGDAFTRMMTGYESSHWQKS